MKKSLFALLAVGIVTLSSVSAKPLAGTAASPAASSSQGIQADQAASAVYALLDLARAKSFTVTYVDTGSTFNDVYSIEGGYLQRSWEQQTYALLDGLVSQYGAKYVYGVKKTEKGWAPTTVLLQADPNQTGKNVPMQTIESVEKVDDLLTVPDLAGKVKVDEEGAYTDDTDIIYDLVAAAHLGSYVGGSYIQRVRLTPNKDGSLTIRLQRLAGLGTYEDFSSDPSENEITYSKLNESSIQDLADFVKTYKMGTKSLADAGSDVVKPFTGENIKVTSKLYFVPDGQTVDASSEAQDTTVFEFSHDNIKLTVDNAASRANGSQFYHRGDLDEAEQQVLLGDNTVKSNPTGNDFDTFVTRPGQAAEAELPYFIQDAADNSVYHYYGIDPDTFFQNFTQLSESIGYVDSLDVKVENGVVSQMVTSGPQSQDGNGNPGHLEVHTTIENTDAAPLGELKPYAIADGDNADFKAALDFLKNPTENFSIVSTFAQDGGDGGIAPGDEGGDVVDPGMGQGGQGTGGGNTLIYDKANDILLRQNGDQSEGWVGKDGKVTHFRVLVDNNAETEEQSFLPNPVGAPEEGKTLDHLSYFNDSQFDLDPALVEKDPTQSDETSSFYVLKNGGEDLADLPYHVLGSSNLNSIYNKTLWFGIQDGRFLESQFQWGGELGAGTDDVAFSYGAGAQALTDFQIQAIKGMADWKEPTSWKEDNVNLYEEVLAAFGNDEAFVSAIPYLYDPSYAGFWLGEPNSNSFVFWGTNMNPDNANAASLFQAKYTALLLSLGFKKQTVAYQTGGYGTVYVKGNMQIRPSDPENNGILVRKIAQSD